MHKESICDANAQIGIIWQHKRKIGKENIAMCGIIGYTGKKEATRELLQGLYALEYRGYDSSGVAVFDRNDPNQIIVKKKKGRISVSARRRCSPCILSSVLRLRILS